MYLNGLREYFVRRVPESLARFYVWSMDSLNICFPPPDIEFEE